MDKTQITSLALKMVGIYILAIALSALPSTFMLISSGDDLTFDARSVQWAKGFVAIPLLLLLLGGLALLGLNRTITMTLVKPDEEPAPDPPETWARIQPLVFVLMGIFLIVSSVPDLIGNVLTLVIVDSQFAPPILRPELVGNVLVAALGIALIATRGKWSTLAERLGSTRPMKRS